MNLRNIGTYLAVWWLRLHTSTARGRGLIPGLGTKIPQAAQLSKTRKEEEREKCIAQINNHGGLSGKTSYPQGMVSGASGWNPWT